MTFHIGRQSGGVINNVGRDQHVTGGQRGTQVAGREARQALCDLRDALAAAPLDPDTARAAGAELTELDTAVSTARPDLSRGAAALDRLTRLLAAAGPLAAAGAALAGPLHVLAGWLGAAG